MGARHYVLRIPLRFWEDRIPRMAGGLAYATLLALAPLTILGFTVASALPGVDGWLGRALDFVYRNFVPEAGGSVEEHLRLFVVNARHMTVFGGVVLFGATALLMANIERALDDIWRVRRPRGIVRRAFRYAAILLVGPVLLGVSLAITSYLVSLPLFAQDDTLSGIRGFLLESSPFWIQWLAITLLYAVIPNARVGWIFALFGGLVAAGLLELTKRAFGFFVAHMASYQVIYGALAALPLFLVWLYWAWLVILVGALMIAELDPTPDRGRRRA